MYSMKGTINWININKYNSKDTNIKISFIFLFFIKSLIKNNITGKIINKEGLLNKISTTKEATVRTILIILFIILSFFLNNQII